MNIRKHWKKFVLTAAAFFWVSCGDDNGASVVESSSSDKVASESSSSAESKSSSSAILDESSSSVAAESSSSEATVESSSGGIVGDCRDAKQFPLAVEGSNLRCFGNKPIATYNKADSAKFSSQYFCCDGSVINAPKYYGDEECASHYKEKSDSIPENVPAYWANDTLYTRQGLKNRNGQKVEDGYRLKDDELSAATIDSLNNATTYCDDHGGIKGRELYSPVRTDEGVCDILREEASRKLYYKTLFGDEASKSEKECVKNKLQDYFECVTCLYGTETVTDKCSAWEWTYNDYEEIYTANAIKKYGKNATFECADGTIVETEEYATFRQAYNEIESRCNVPLDDFVNRMESCKK